MDQVNGLYYIENVIDEKHADELISQLDIQPWIPITDSSKSRKVQHYGFKYNYKTGNVKDVADPIPDFMQTLLNDLSDICKTKAIPSTFNQCIVNNYEVGQSISPHIDHRNYGPVIGCYTLNSGATMRFRKGNEKVEIYVKPNSLYIMSEDARYNWTHEMTTHKFDTTTDHEKVKRDRRISITFRYVEK